MNITNALNQQAQQRQNLSRYTALLAKDDPADATEVAELAKKLGRDPAGIAEDQRAILQTAATHKAAAAPAAPAKPPADTRALSSFEKLHVGLQAQYAGQPAAQGDSPVDDANKPDLSKLSLFQKLELGLAKLGTGSAVKA